MTEAAVARGAVGALTFFVYDEIYFGKDRLRDAEERAVALQARGAARPQHQRLQG